VAQSLGARTLMSLSHVTQPSVDIAHHDSFCFKACMASLEMP
jgi:hypothetical protein